MRDEREQANRLRPDAKRLPMSGAHPLGAPRRDEDPLPARPHLRLVPDTLETLLTRVVADLRSSLPDATPEFASACRRDAIAVIDAGHAAGLFRTQDGPSTGQG